MKIEVEMSKLEAIALKEALKAIQNFMYHDADHEYTMGYLVRGVTIDITTKMIREIETNMGE